MNIRPLVSRLRRHAAVSCGLLAVATMPFLSGCGGGSAGSGQPTVTNLSASGMAFSRTMTVTVNGSGLADTGIFMTVDGPCGPSTRSGAATDFQVQFTCQVIGVGTLSPRIRKANGDELGRVQVSVPQPQVSINVKQGDRTGTMVLELDAAAAPVSALNFITYVNNAFYSNTLFHRVLKNKIAQGGGYITGAVLKPATGAAIVLESNNGLKNLRGTIAMARTTAFNSATSQFYFNISDNPEFDYVSAEQPGYAVFGKLVSGLDVLDEIGKVDTFLNSVELQNLPSPEVFLTTALQIR